MAAGILNHIIFGAKKRSGASQTWDERDGSGERACQTRISSGNKIANVNFLYDDIVHVLQNTIESRVNSATGRHGYVLERRFIKFSEIT